VCTVDTRVLVRWCSVVSPAELSDNMSAIALGNDTTCVLDGRKIVRCRCSTGARSSWRSRPTATPSATSPCTTTASCVGGRVNTCAEASSCTTHHARHLRASADLPLRFNLEVRGALWKRRLASPSSPSASPARCRSTCR
jgi:hypothetical protein